MTLVGVVLLIVVVALLLALAWWLLVASEGVYLGRQVVIWLYDLYAGRYDRIKDFQRIYEHALLAQPIMEHIAPHRAPLVLDVATGTGRLPLALLKHMGFQGRIIGLDLSHAMLDRAAGKLSGYGDRVALLWSPAEKLPFADNTFDVVTCLESLEFMDDPAAVVHELIRVLRLGGLLLMTQRINARLMPGKTWTRDQLAAFLVACDIEQADVEAWQEDYHKVWAIKTGDSAPTGARPLDEVLRCPCCNDTLMQRQPDAWACPTCQRRAPIAPNGIIQLFAIGKSC